MCYDVFNPPAGFPSELFAISAGMMGVSYGLGYGPPFRISHKNVANSDDFWAFFCGSWIGCILFRPFAFRYNEKPQKFGRVSDLY